MKRSKKLKLFAGLTIAIIVLCFVFRNVLDRKLVFDEITFTSGCEKEFCIGDNKEKVIESVKAVLATDNAKLIYKYTDLPTKLSVELRREILLKEGVELYYQNSLRAISPDDLKRDILLKNDLWTLFTRGKLGFNRTYYLYFEGGVLFKVEVRKQGPLYFDL